MLACKVSLGMAAMQQTGREGRWKNRLFRAMSPDVRGIRVDAQTRCAHYNSPLDVIAIKMKCCQAYFACKDCHDILADHPLEPWPREEREQRAVLCGVCGSDLRIAQYLENSDHCPTCRAPFNPNCREHHCDYFSM